MDWAGTLERYGWAVSTVGSEPFTPLGAQAGAARARGESIARISATVGSSTDYGGVKVSFTVSVDAVQTEAAMNLAGEAAFKKAVELVNDGARVLGAPEVPVNI